MEWNDGVEVAAGCNEKDGPMLLRVIMFQLNILNIFKLFFKRKMYKNTHLRRGVSETDLIACGFADEDVDEGA